MTTLPNPSRAECEPPYKGGGSRLSQLTPTHDSVMTQMTQVARIQTGPKWVRRPA